MKRKEYIEQLRDAMAFLPEESRRAVLAFYTEMLDDRMEDGMDEESAVSAMEKPEDIAARLRAEGIAEEIAAASPLHVGVRDEALEFASLADSALKGVESAMRQAPASPEPEEKTEKQPEEDAAQERPAAGTESGKQASWHWEGDWQDAVDGALEAAGKALEKAGKTLESFLSDQSQAAKGGEKSEYERREVTCPAEAVNAVRLAVTNMPIAVRAASGNEIKLVYYTSERHPYRAAAEEGVLTLRSEDKENGRGFRFSFFNDGMKLIWNQPSPTVELFLPSGALLDLKAHTSNGSIRLEEVRGLCDVDLKTSNSRISVRQVTAKALEAQTSNSRLVLEDVESKQLIRGKTSNARIEANQVKAGGEIVLGASNGRVNLENVTAGGALTATTSNASIQADRISAAAVTLRSSNGAIRGILPGRQADWAVASSTSNGKNSLPRQQAGERPLNVHTSNASIDVRFEKG